MGTGGTMRKEEEIAQMYNTLLEIQANNISSSADMDGFRRALWWVLNEDYKPVADEEE